MALTTLPTAAFASGSVGTGQLADGAVTTEKLVADVNFRNIVINGDMSIDQRGITATANNQFPVDRFFYNDAQNYDQLSFSATQDTDVPTGQGFAKSLKVAVNTPETAIASDEYSRIMTRFEGQNVQHLKYGTSSAESVTLSFWLKTNVTGNFTVSLFQDDDSRIIGTTYSATSSGVWEKITITFDPDTVGVIDNDNGSGLRVMFLLTAGTNFTSSDNTSWGSYSNAKLAYGQTASLMSTTSGYWNITGVQLEVGTSASDFEFLPHDVNMQRCMRYLQHTPYITGANSMTAPTNEGIEIMGARHKFADVHGYRSQTITHYVPMRAQPSFTFYNPSNSGTTGQFRLYDKDGNTQNFSGFVQLWDRYGFNMGGYTGVSVGTAGDSLWILGMHWKADAEL